MSLFTELTITEQESLSGGDGKKYFNHDKWDKDDKWDKKNYRKYWH